MLGGNSGNDSGFPEGLFDGLKVADGEASQDALRPGLEFQNAGALIELEDRVVIGREEVDLPGWAVQAVRHRGIAEQHVAIAFDQNGRCWMLDLAPADDAVFVDGRRCLKGELKPSQVLQIGALAWRVDLDQKRMVPVSPISGLDLAVDAEVEHRLTRTRLEIDRGEMTALVGPSGCGKSTLLETIRDGSGLAGDSDLSGHVFFVPQKDLVHGDLRLGDALQMIGRLYGREVLPFEIDAALDSVGLPTSAKTKFPRELSGGQLRRFRIAGALLSGAGVIVLDEPDSGLDHETADEVISLLRSLAVRGATIIAVTHHRHVLESFDRVITMRTTEQGGAVESDGLGSEARKSTGVDEVPNASTNGFFRQLGILLNRERKKITSPVLARLSFGPLRVPHCLVGLLLVPLLFAVAVAVSVPTDPDRNVADGLFGEIGPISRLGFLAVVSVIWMSASGSHLSITRDRELLDYELSYGLGWTRVLSAKSIVLVAAGVLQTVVFAGLLYLIRYVWLDRSFFINERWTQLAGVLLVLVCISLAATMLGLLISVLAGRSPLIATAVLPVVMMFQILFSAPFAVSNPDGYEPLADYDQLTIVQEVDAESDDDWEEDWEDDLDQERPLWVTSLVSYGTLSRYGDQWIRSFAVTTDPVEEGRKVQSRSMAATAMFAVGCFVASWLGLMGQTSRLGKRRVG